MTTKPRSDHWMQIATLPVAWPTHREDTSHGLAWRGYAGSPTIASPGPIGIELLAGENGHVHLHGLVLH